MPDAKEGGAAKAKESAAKTVSGAITTRIPASLLQLHAKVEILLDEAAASRLRSEGVVTSRGGRVHER